VAFGHPHRWPLCIKSTEHLIELELASRLSDQAIAVPGATVSQVESVTRGSGIPTTLPSEPKLYVTFSVGGPLQSGQQGDG